MNQNLVPPWSPVTLVATSEDRGLYGIRIQYQSQEITLYASNDCSLLLPGNYNLNQEGGARGTGSGQGAQATNAAGVCG